MRVNRVARRIVVPLFAVLLAGCSAAGVPPTTPSPGLSTAAEAPVAVPPLPSGSIGWDVSYPQGTTLPEPREFAIVGVNGKLPNQPNPDFSPQIAWASTSKQPPMLYVNAANPAGFNTASWPRSGKNRFGECDGGVSTACSYQYGQDRIMSDLDFMSPSTMKNTVVFIAVEKRFSWRDKDQTSESNIATLEGMADAIRDAGGQPGFYATGNDWRTQISADEVNLGDNLYGTPIWWRGARDMDEAKANCGQRSFTGGKILVAQIPAENVGARFDQNLAC